MYTTFLAIITFEAQCFNPTLAKITDHLQRTNVPEMENSARGLRKAGVCVRPGCEDSSGGGSPESFCLALEGWGLDEPLD